MIKVKNLSKTYYKGKENEIKVINDTTLYLPDNGLISFLGQSGSGKTTLLNTIGGLDKADSGSISYDDVEMKRYNMTKADKYRSENIGYVFQNYLLLDYLSVYDNLKLALSLIDITDQAEVKKRIEFALKAVGLYKYRKKLAGQLSGGQQQRVSIARALVKKCKVIIADEPTGNLDSENTIEVMNILKKVSKESLVLLVTHNREIAEFYSDKIVELKDGKVLSFTPNESTANLEALSDKKIHLLDYDNNNIEASKLKVNLYTDESSKDQEITIVIRNNTVYIDTKSRIQLVADSSYELVNDHYQAIKRDDIDSFNYDTSWFNEKKNRNGFVNFFKDLGSSFTRFYTDPRRKKVFNVIFGLIGVLLALIVALQINTTAVNTTNISNEPNVYTLAGGTYDAVSYELIYGGVEKGYINNVYNSSNHYISVSVNSHIKKSSSYYAYTYLYSSVSDKKLIAGNAPKNMNEIVLGKKLADTILNGIGSGYTYKDLIGMLNDSMLIVGVSSANTNSIYALNNKICIYSKDDKIDEFYNKSSAKYTITSGVEPTDDLTCIVHEDSDYKINDKITHNNKTVTVVGKYKPEADFSDDYYDVENIAITSDKTALLLYYSDSSNFEYGRIYGINPSKEASDYFKSRGFTYYDHYTYEYNQLLKSCRSEKNVYIIIEIVVLAVVLIYTYFSQRAKMISEIYDIGVLRSLGCKRSRIISKSIKDIFAKATLTTLLGYVVSLALYYFIAGRVNALAGRTMLAFNMTYAIIGVIILYLSQILIGIIPLLLLLAKTPSEINSKYDI